jgi:thiol:disulfide interchange protein
VVAGAVIAAAVPQAAIAIPLALASHFVMDALPHYGDNDKHSWLNRHFKYVLGIDLLLTLLFLLALIIAQPIGWVLLVVCGLVAVSPDILWLPYFLADLKHEHREHSRLAKLLKWIQWGERPWGIYIEGATLIGLLTLFVAIMS